MLVGLAASALLVWLLPGRYESSFVIEPVGPTSTAESAVRDALSSTAPEEIDVRVAGGEGTGIRVTCAGARPGPVRIHCARMLASLMGGGEGPAEAMPPASDALEAEARRVAASLGATRDSLAMLGREMEEEAGAHSRRAAAAREERDRLDLERAATARLIDDLAQGGGSHLDLARYPPAIRGAAAPLVRALTRLETRRASLAATRSIRNPDLVAIDRESGAARNRLRGLLVRREATLRAEVRSADRASRAGRAPSGAASEEAQRLEGRIARLDGQRRELFANLDARRAEPRLPPRSVRVLREASEPGEPSAPDAAPFLAGGAVIGLALGLAGAIRRERADRRLRTPAEIADAAGLPVLLILPAVRDARPLLPVRPLAASVPVPRMARKSRQAAALLRSLDSLPSRIDMMRWASGGGDIRSVAINGATRQRESTIVACNLALVRAARGARTLLVEGDFEDDTLARFFRIPCGQPGLMDVLGGQTEIEAVSCRYAVGERGELAILTRGDATVKETLRTLAEVLREAERAYEAIIVDAPPYDALGPALPIAGSVDATLLVITVDTVGPEALKRAVDRIGLAGGRLLGVVVTDPWTVT